MLVQTLHTFRYTPRGHMEQGEIADIQDDDATAWIHHGLAIQVAPAIEATCETATKPSYEKALSRKRTKQV